MDEPGLVWSMNSGRRSSRCHRPCSSRAPLRANSTRQTLCSPMSSCAALKESYRESRSRGGLDCGDRGRDGLALPCSRQEGQERLLASCSQSCGEPWQGRPQAGEGRRVNAIGLVQHGSHPLRGRELAVLPESHMESRSIAAWHTGTRLAACCHTTDLGPSMTSEVTSWPRKAGRQCMKTLRGAQISISLTLT